ncbi:MAG: hypothetical protein ABL884_06925 [Methyloglobulus sp.]
MTVKKILLNIDQASRYELAERAARLMPNGSPLQLSPLTQSIQFLRGVSSRASLCIPAFHFFVGSQYAQEDVSIKEKYSLAVSASYIEFSSMNTITLSCRKAFDHDKKGLTGAKFSKISDNLLLEHAQYWAKNSGRPVEDASAALKFLREFFRICSQHSSRLLQANTSLQKRIGILKQHADRAAAHLSLENYEIHLYDLAHFTASLCLVGEIIRSFDAQHMGNNYFNQVEIGSYEAAKELFPMLGTPRLFKSVDIERQAIGCWRFGEKEGLHMLLEQLPYAISWF